MKKIYLIILATISFIGCEKVVDADKLLGTEEQVFISSYIAPTDTLLRVNVSKALPAIGTSLLVEDFEVNQDQFLIKDAVVTIADEEGTIASFAYSEEEASYISEASNLAILEGKQYFLNVIANGQEFNASCEIPKKVGSITETQFIESNGFGGEFTRLNVSFTDIVGERNFYVLGGFSTVTFEEETFRNPIFYESFGLLNDAVQDGIILSADSGFLYSGELEEPLEVVLQVAHVEEIVYQSLQASNLNQNNDGNPFVEYSIAADNIIEENGVGIFAGYQVTEKVVVFE